MKLFYFAPFVFAAVACQPTESSSGSKATPSYTDSSVAIFTDSLIQPDKEVQMDKGELRESSHEEDVAGKEHDQIALAEIKANFKRINSIDSWDSVKMEEVWKSTEGGEIKKYFKNQVLEKVIYREAGENYQFLNEYYLLDNQLSFVFERVISYNRPITWDSSVMVSMNDTAVHDFSKSEIEETRSYFKKGEIVRQLNNQDCGSPFATEYLEAEQTRIEKEWTFLSQKS